MTNPGNAEEYWQSGGMLDRFSFDRAMRVLSESIPKNNPLPIRNRSLAQVENMAIYSDVPLTPGQQYLYMVLREMTSENERGSDFPSETPGTVPAWVLTDQRLLAEVLRLTDKKKLDFFMRAYPNIWYNRVVEP